MKQVQARQQDSPKGNNYYFNFEELKIQQKIEPDRKEHSYNQEQALSTIREELYNMFDDGYDFRFTEHLDYKSMKRIDRKSSFKRKSWMRFACSNKKCPHLIEKNIPARWTSYYGLVQYRFTIKGLEKDYISSFDYEIGYPFKVEFHFQIFKQKCKKCNEFSSGEIYESQLITISRMFCWIIAQMLDNPNERSPKRKRAEQRLDEDQYDSMPPIDQEKKHKSMNCQACLLNKCKHKQMRPKVNE